MNILIRHLVGALALALLSSGVKAQHTTAIERASAGVIYSAGLESGLTTGSARNNHQWFFGGYLQADIPISRKVYFNINTGYNQFFGKDNINGTSSAAPDMHLLPVIVGFKTFLLPVLYLQGGQGVGFLLNKRDLGYNRTVAFLYAQQLGVELPLKGHNFLDAGIRYEGTTKFATGDKYSKLNSLSIRLAYAFGSK